MSESLHVSTWPPQGLLPALQLGRDIELVTSLSEPNTQPETFKEGKVPVGSELENTVHHGRERPGAGAGAELMWDLQSGSREMDVCVCSARSPLPIV